MKRRYVLLVIFVIFVVIVYGRCGGLDADTDYWVDSESPIVQEGKSVRVDWVGSNNRVKKSKIKWSASNKKVRLKVAKNKRSCRVYGLKVGSSRIKLTYKGKKIGSVLIYVSGSSLDTTQATLSVGKSKTIKLKKYLNNKSWVNLGKKIKWSCSNKGVKIKQDKLGNSCKVTAKLPGIYIVKAIYGKQLVGKSTIIVPNTETIKPNGIGNLVVGFNELGSRYSPYVTYKVNLSGGSLFTIDTEDIEWVNRPSNSLFLDMSVDVDEHDSSVWNDGQYGSWNLRACLSGIECVKLRYRGIDYTFLVTVSDEDAVTAPYERWMRSVVACVPAGLSEEEKIRMFYPTIKSMEYRSGQWDKYYAYTTNIGNCLSGNNILKDYCIRLGIKCERKLIDGDYLKKSVLEALRLGNYYNSPHTLCILEMDGEGYVVDATPCNRSVYVAYDYEKACIAEWVNVWKEYNK